MSIAGMAMLVLGACQTTVETTQGASSDDRLQMYLIDARYRDGAVINTLMVWDRGAGRWVVNVSGHGSTWARAIITDMLSPSVVPALISGEYGVRIARENECQDDNCGTIINTSASSQASNENGVDIQASAQ